MHASTCARPHCSLTCAAVISAAHAHFSTHRLCRIFPAWRVPSLRAPLSTPISGPDPAPTRIDSFSSSTRRWTSPASSARSSTRSRYATPPRANWAAGVDRSNHAQYAHRVVSLVCACLFSCVQLPNAYPLEQLSPLSVCTLDTMPQVISQTTDDRQNEAMVNWHAGPRPHPPCFLSCTHASTR